MTRASSSSSAFNKRVGSWGPDSMRNLVQPLEVLKADWPVTKFKERREPHTSPWQDTPFSSTRRLGWTFAGKSQLDSPSRPCNFVGVHLSRKYASRSIVGSWKESYSVEGETLGFLKLWIRLVRNDGTFGWTIRTLGHQRVNLALKMVYYGRYCPSRYS